jgi:hypothetical protein
LVLTKNSFENRHYLLAVTGYDAEKLSRSFHSVNLKTTFEPLGPVGITDIDSYLRHEQEMIILTAIEEAKKEVGLFLFFLILYNIHDPPNFDSLLEQLHHRLQKALQRNM